MKHLLYIAITIGIFFCSCIDYKSKKENTVITNGSIIEKYKFVSYKYCSEDLLWDDDIYGNIRLEITPNNNFLKCTAINDSVLVFSCGRGKLEVVLYEVECRGRHFCGFDGSLLPKLEYDDGDMMILYLKGGSDSWVNYFIYFGENAVYYEQAVYIDTENRRYVYLAEDYKHENVFFVVHNIMFNTRDTLKSNYYKFRKDGYPAFFISDVSMNYDTLFYSVKTINGSIKDTLYARCSANNAVKTRKSVRIFGQ